MDDLDTAGLETLTAWCEEGFAAVRAGFVTAGVPGTDTWFTTVCNEVAALPEGAEPVGAPTASRAIEAFEKGWEQFRKEHPGDVLCWRRKPCWITAWGGGFVIYCRAAVV